MSAPGKPLEEIDEPSGRTAPEAALAERTVLVVDDVPYLRELAALFLARTVKVATAESGSEALVLARRLLPDLILCDDRMPGMDGLAVCRAIRAEPELAGTPFVMLLSDPAARAHGKAIRMGADDVLAKPLERLPLIETVTRFLSFTEVRGIPRAETDLAVTICGTGLHGPGLMRNVSRGGAFVETELELDGARELGLRFELPERDAPLCPAAKVVWTRRRYASEPASDGAGLQFTEIDAATARAIDDYVYERTSQGVL